jgi:serpin B
MYLINAIYFKGVWHKQFDTSNTFNHIFHTSGETELYVDFMRLSDTLKLVETSRFVMTEIPYGQGNFSMLILLPYSFSTDDIVDSLTTENWISWTQKMNRREVDLSLPKFRFSYDNELKSELTNLGLGLAFSDQADFSGMNGTGGLKISRVIHKSFIEVNEVGTEAAAVTGVEMIPLSLTPTGPYYFYVDRPFLFAIREVTTNVILFLGRVQNPLTEGNGE